MLPSLPLVFLREGKRESQGGGKVGNSPRLRVFQGAVGAVGNLGLVFHGFHGTVFSTAFGWFQRAAGLRIASHHMGTEANRYRAVQVLVNGYGPIRQAVAPAAFLDLPAAILNGHRALSTTRSVWMENTCSRSRRPHLRKAVPGTAGFT